MQVKFSEFVWLYREDVRLLTFLGKIELGGILKSNLTNYGYYFDASEHGVSYLFYPS